jgi:hypothetical protein
MRIVWTSNLVRLLVLTALVLAGAGALFAGIGGWMVSGCCGSSDPSEPGYLLVGAVSAGALWWVAWRIR